jgi:hypothetical protein
MKKKMKRYLLILLLLFTVLSFSACKKFLEEQSQTDVIPRNAEDLNEMLIGNAYTATGVLVESSLKMMDDDISQDGFVPSTDNSFRFGSYTWQPMGSALGTEAPVGSVWQQRYPLIMGCNVALQYAGKVNGTTAEIENVEGQAYLLRAYNYFLLVNYFGKPYTDRLSNPEEDLAVPLMLDGNLSLEGKPRNTVAEVYRQILSDLDNGITLLERSGKNNNLFRISPVAGYLLLSRVHLYMGNWQKSVEAATNVLIRKSTLMDLTTWGTANQTTKPIVDLPNVETIWGHGNSTIILSGDDVSYRLSDQLLSLFETGDLRSTIYINNRRSIKRPFASTSAKVGQAFRVSEALLNRAEAYAQLNKLGQTANAQLALNDLNTLRKKRFTAATYKDLTSSGADDLLQKCALERRKELFAEESHRWFDLRRSGMPAINHVFFPDNAQVITYTLQERDPAYLLQIPIQVLNQNPKLVANPLPAVREAH